MPTPPRTALPQSSKPFLNRAASTNRNLFRWSVVRITTRSSWRASLPPPCCSSLAAMDIATGRTSTHLRKILLEEHSCSPRLSPACPSDLVPTASHDGEHPVTHFSDSRILA